MRAGDAGGELANTADKGAGKLVCLSSVCVCVRVCEICLHMWTSNWNWLTQTVNSAPWEAVFFFFFLHIQMPHPVITGKSSIKMSQTNQSKLINNLCRCYHCAITNDILDDNYKWHTVMKSTEESWLIRGEFKRGQQSIPCLFRRLTPAVRARILKCSSQLFKIEMIGWLKDAVQHKRIRNYCCLVL